jgi:ATP-binding cassette subfamily B protein
MIQRAISSLVNGRTVVMIVHRLKTVQNAHQSLVVDKGSIAERGTHTELMVANGLYRRLWELQNQSTDWQL